MIALENQCELFEYEMIEDEIVLKKWISDTPEVKVPEKWENFPITQIDAYAFSGGHYRAISLPNTIRKIGRYAFYNCFELLRFSFATSISDIGAGAFTGCRKVRGLEVYQRDTKRSCFRDVLSEFTEEISVVYHTEEEAHLMFPEFYEEGIENTPARIIMTEIHGTGMYYRNSFVNGELQFSEYDRRFEMAKAQEYPGFLIRLVIGRLLYPYRLEDKAKTSYEQYLMEHPEDAVDYLVQTRDISELQKMIAYDMSVPEGKDKIESLKKAILNAAQKAGWTEAVSYLMDRMRDAKPKRRMSFQL
ncbi:MAG: leucine-rich repeat domain-containing protein [Eubacteriales bacterium]|nr:leucine-rich repeat domain-containing protein [Eubacteriales bacterium]